MTLRLCKHCRQVVKGGGVNIKNDDGTIDHFHGQCFNIVNKEKNRKREGKIDVLNPTHPQHPTFKEGKMEMGPNKPWVRQ